MGANLSVVNDRESTPDPWWPNSQNKSTNVTASVNANSANLNSQEDQAAAAVASVSGVPTTSITLDEKRIEECEESKIQCDDCTLFENDSRHEENQKKLELFKQELATKREARQKAIAALTDKLKQLQEQVKTEEKARQRAENEVIRLKEVISEGGFRKDLEEEKNKVKNLEKELEKERKLRLALEKDKEDAQEKEQQIRALKEVATIGKEMLRIRELQVNELKKKLCETQYPEDLREEYEAQIQHVRRLKTLYEERAEAVRLEHQREIDREVARIKALETKITEFEHERKEAEVMREHLKDRVLKLDQELEERNDAAMALQEQLDASVIESRDLASQMSLINNLFSQMLVGNLNLDRITRLVEENQSLVIDLTSDDKKNDLAALLIDIAKQLDDNYSADEKSIDDEQQAATTNLNINNNGTMTQQEVASNLSKVWRILVQLLTQDQGTSTPTTSECDSESCYKSVETPSGKRSVISVSQTFLTLKSLILEKNALIKEVNKLKLLNEHLETRLGNQEKRLSTVSTELKKTWDVVSKLRVQHKQLHTQEKILKYELQHKRLMLNDLKDELERCKEIWDMARQKNYQSEEEWRKLRKEFADRRKNTDISNSAESGYEDDESNTPPTEDSIDEQELDRLIDPEGDSFSMINEELRPNIGNMVGDIGNVDNDSNDDYQNDSDNTVELLETDYSIYDEDITLTDENQNMTGNNSEEMKITLQNKEEILTKNVNRSKSEIPETNSKTTINDTRPSQSTKSSVQDTSAENISKFLEGLLASDDSIPEDKAITVGNANQLVNTNDFSDATCTSTSTDNTVKINDSKSDELEIKNSELNCVTKHSSNSESCLPASQSNSIPELEKCISQPHNWTNESLMDRVEFENSSISNFTIGDINSNNAESSLSIPSNDHQFDEGNYKLDEACGYSPNYNSAQSKTIELQSINEVLNRLSPPKDEPSASSTLDYQSDKKLNENRTAEQVLDARTERLKRLEEQCKSLVNKVTATTIKSNVLSSKLELLHEQYGRSTESFDDISSSSTSTTNRQDDNSKENVDIISDRNNR